ncbi:MAG: 4-alpha-glucanotransferase, partial [Gammaproteobacteria bacterium]|nr:4-alpha-glucanotransferase [Gammaproteobacteria bacterium]
MSELPELRRLAGNLGVETSHTEIGGRRRDVSEETLRAVLGALGRAAAEHAARRQGGLAPGVVPSFEPGPVRVPLDGDPRAVEWEVAGEGRELSGRAAAGELERENGKTILFLPPVAPGYYRLRLAAGPRRARSFLIRAPARAWLPAALERERGYGLSVQLYELVGPNSLGIGGFDDLAGLGEAAGRMGAATLGVNPLHALFLCDPERASPYSPSSRLALNPLYLDPQRLPGFDVRAGEKSQTPDFRARRTALNAQPLVHYSGAAREKLVLARLAFEDFRAAGEDPAFARFCRAAGGAKLWARHETLAAEYGADWRAWPAGLRDPDGAAVERYIAGHGDRLDFHLWLQWQAERQLERAARAAREAGMAVGLYRDLALGADPGGAESWAGQADHATGLAVGAPPDPFNPRGQNWGFAPLVPERLVAGDFAPFIELVRANMRCAGALRMDHVLGLNRLFVIPDGAEPQAGAYLRYPFEALLAVVVLESLRCQCLVVGEDLGTVPQGLRATLARRGIFSMHLLYFEHDDTGRPRRPQAWPSGAVAAVGTHDMVPLAGWWHGGDLARMERLGLWPDPEASAAARRERTEHRKALAETLHASGEEEVPAVAAYRHLARTPSRLVMIQPGDALGIEAPVNQPGTTHEEPNWRRRRLPPWPEWLADPRFAALVRALQEERGGPPVRPQTTPTATYRLQLNHEFGLCDAARIAPYLARLGASHLYLSPVMRATPGSTHGYDMVDPARLDAERGGEAGFAELLTACSQNDLAPIVDYVPNHMGANGANPWWSDLLEWGLASRYAKAFDVDWAAAGGRIVLPLLGRSLARTLARGEVGLEFGCGGGFAAVYYEHRLPLAPASMSQLLASAARELEPGADRTALQALARRARALAQYAEAERRAVGLTWKAELATLAGHPPVHEALEQAAANMAADRNRFARLLARQHWRLVYWRRGLEEINYRRFFDVASLAGMRVERPAIFAAAHVRIRAFLAGRALAGLRLDHVDGLAAPTRYLEALAQLVAVHGGGVPLWVEKILGVNEALPDWPIAGTTGYEFLNDVTRLFMSQSGARRLRALWRELAPNAMSFAATLAHAKRAAIRNLLAPSLARVTDALVPHAPVPRRILRAALVEALVALPVYRLYPDERGGPTLAESECLARMTAAAARVDGAAGAWLAKLIERS